MANIIHRGKGRPAVQLVDWHGRRPTVGLGNFERLKP
jgi:hypothetical protein